MQPFCLSHFIESNTPFLEIRLAFSRKEFVHEANLSNQVADLAAHILDVLRGDGSLSNRKVEHKPRTCSHGSDQGVIGCEVNANLMRIHVFTTLFAQRMLCGQGIGSRECRRGHAADGLLVLFSHKHKSGCNVCPTETGGIYSNVSWKSHIGECMLC